MADESYVLYEPLASENQGLTLCFVQMTSIGPMTSEDPAEWARFPSEGAALQSPAFYHALTCYEPRLASELEPSGKAA